jgi:hypothetical protein
MPFILTPNKLINTYKGLIPKSCMKINEKLVLQFKCLADGSLGLVQNLGNKNLEDSMDYKKTLSLPATRFPMKANLAKREPQQLKKWEEDRLYDQSK